MYSAQQVCQICCYCLPLQELNVLHGWPRAPSMNQLGYPSDPRQFEFRFFIARPCHSECTFECILGRALRLCIKRCSLRSLESVLFFFLSNLHFSLACHRVMLQMIDVSINAKSVAGLKSCTVTLLVHISRFYFSECRAGFCACSCFWRP